MNWFDIFEYRNEKLYWKITPGQRARAGSEVECSPSHEYMQVQYKGKRQGIHRIVWEMACGPIPDGYYVDHVNGDRSDNRVDNLRLATKAENNWNASKRKDNTSGLKGVYWKRQIQKWGACICVFGKQKHLGFFLTAEDAYQTRVEAERFYFGEFAPSEKRKLAATR